MSRPALLLVLAALACGKAPPANVAAAAELAPAERAALEVVPRERVCVVWDSRFPNQQMPVTVDGKTYRVCCTECKDRLLAEPGVRVAVDPVSGRTVDKSEAVIAATPKGHVLYFESEATLATFRGH